MNRLNRHILLAISFTTLFAGTVLAETPASGMPGYHGDCPMVQDSPRAERKQQRMREQMAQRMEQHQKQLKQALKLTPAQEPAWQQFADALKPQGHKGPAMKRDEWKKLTTPQRLEQMQAHKAERDAQMKTHIEAIQKFYGTLSPEQQKTFDAQFMHFGGPGNGHKMMR